MHKTEHISSDEIPASLALMLLAEQKGLLIESNNLNTPFYVLTNTRYHKKDELTEVYLDETCCDNHPVKEKFRLYACSLSTLQKWLREKHNIHAEAHVNDDGSFIGTLSYFTPDARVDAPFIYHLPTYEAALEEALKVGFNRL